MNGVQFKYFTVKTVRDRHSHPRTGYNHWTKNYKNVTLKNTLTCRHATPYKTLPGSVL